MALRFRSGLIGLALLIAGLMPTAAQAATLYISEFPNGVTPVGSLVSTYTPPQPSIADQTVAISGTSAASAAFNAKTHVVALVCDEGCSVSFTGASPTATTSNFLLQQGVTYLFGVAPGGKVAAIENSAGNIGGSTGPNVNLVQVGGVAVALGQAAMAASLPVAIASNQSPVPVEGTGTSGTPAGGVLTIQGQSSMEPVAVDIATQDVPVVVEQAGYSLQNITTSTTTTVKSGAGVLHIVNVNTDGTVASTVTIYDNTAGSGTKIATIDSLTLSGPFQYDIAFTIGLTLVTTGTSAPDITVSYR